MGRWTREIPSMSMNDILEAVNNDAWQRFRKSLKGLPTEEKLHQLNRYLERREVCDTCSPGDYIRVSNYINALLRGVN